MTQRHIKWVLFDIHDCFFELRAKTLRDIPARKKKLFARAITEVTGRSFTPREVNELHRRASQAQLDMPHTRNGRLIPINEYYGRVNRESIRPFFSEATLKDGIAIRKRFVQLTEGQYRIHSGWKRLFARLKRKKIRLAIASNSRKRAWEIRQMLEEEGVAHYFDRIFTATTLRTRKPMPGYWLRICEILKVAPSEVLMVGNSVATDGASTRLPF